MLVKKKHFYKLVLLVFGTLVGMAILEVAVRIVRPDLKTVVEYEILPDRFRIYTNPRNHSFEFPHPDRNTKHLILHNSLGLRQSREFQAAKPPSTTRIGVFGDSFTENLAMEVQYVFTEPLDYLLNRTGRSFEVINFGTNGYGTDQSYLQYLDEGRALGLDAVFYLHCQNDLGDNLADRLIELDDLGQIRYRPVKPVGLAKRILRRLYLTYFVIEKVSRFGVSMTAILEDELEGSKLEEAQNEVKNQGLVGEIHDEYQLTLMKKEEISNPKLRNALRLFTAIMKTWSEEAKANSSTLYMGIIPGYGDEVSRGLAPSRPFGHYNAALTQLVEKIGIKTLNLHPFFVEMEKQGVYGFPLNDGHWGSEGNKLAAVMLFKFLGDKLGLNHDDDFIMEGLFEYYSSFSPSRVGTAWQKEIPVSEALKKEIFSKYLALEKHD